MFGDAAGPLLHVLAAGRGRERVALVDLDGIGAAWIVAALDPAVTVVAAAREPKRAERLRALLADDPQARVLEGDWRGVLAEHAPFDLVACGIEPEPEALLRLLAPRATVVAPAGARLEHAELVVADAGAVVVAVRRA